MKRRTFKLWDSTLALLDAVAKAKGISKIATVHQLVKREHNRLVRLGKIKPEGAGQGG